MILLSCEITKNSPRKPSKPSDAWESLAEPTVDGRRESQNAESAEIPSGALNKVTQKTQKPRKYFCDFRDFCVNLKSAISARNTLREIRVQRGWRLQSARIQRE